MTRGLLKHRAPGKAKKANRLKRAKRARMKIRELNTLRLTVHRTPQHIYAQVIGAEAGSDRILVQASTLDKSLKVGNGGNVEAATAVGALVAERATAAGVRKVAFDRSGYKYHGRVKALADAARAGGLEF
ncbi:MAG: 50S ribosomal protein L18 [Gammaproteobacteria bacterium]|nr:50S ribosomal protein L18 [Gammaproteobacteria bacterium]